MTDDSASDIVDDINNAKEIDILDGPMAGQIGMIFPSEKIGDLTTLSPHKSLPNSGKTYLYKITEKGLVFVQEVFVKIEGHFEAKYFKRPS